MGGNDPRRRSRREMTLSDPHHDENILMAKPRRKAFGRKALLGWVVFQSSKRALPSADAFATSGLAIAVPTIRKRKPLNLFFPNRDQDGNFVTSKGKSNRNDLLDELRSASISFPKAISDRSKQSSLVLRYMTTEDLKALVPMCIDEFGSLELQQRQKERQQPALGNRLPRWLLDPRQIPDLWEDYSFELLIYWTLRLKLMQGRNHLANNDSPIPKDPIMLVLCEERKQAKSLWKKAKETKKESLQVVVGMVELSLQPPDADRNPPALPLPRWIKGALAKHKTIDGILQGWVTNLLVAEDSRGKGYSKLLMAAVEGIAKHSWECSKIYLHADADIRSGRVPQSLYESLGYELVVGSTHKASEETMVGGDSNASRPFG